MAIVANKKFEPIVIEIDGKQVEICACGQTKNEDRTCDGTHKILNAEMENETAQTKKTMSVVDVLTRINEELKSEKHECACGGHCGCGGH